MDSSGDGDKRDVRRPMNAFLIFCKRHRSIVREKNPDLDNRSVTRILGDLWANLKEEEKVVYTDLAKQYKDAFMKANPDYKWHNPEKTLGCQKSLAKPTNAKVMKNEIDLLPEGSIIPGKLADPCNMGGLSLLLMAGEQSGPVSATSPRSADTPFSLSGNMPIKVKSELSMVVSDRGPAIMSEREQTVVSERGPAIVIDNVPKTVTLDNFENVKVSSQRHGDVNTGLELKEKVVSLSEESKNPVREKKTWADFLQTKSSSMDFSPKVFDPSIQPVTSLETLTNKSLLYQVVAAPKIPQRSLLAEAFRDKGGYPDILRDNSTGTKMANFNNQGKLFDDQFTTGTLEQKLIQKTDEKENLTKTLAKEVRENTESKSESDEESAMVTCGKLVVNHIIDKLYSSELGTSVKKGNNSDEVDGVEKDSAVKANITVKSCAIKNENTNKDVETKNNNKATALVSAMSKRVYDKFSEKSTVTLEGFETTKTENRDEGNDEIQSKKLSKRQIQSGTDSTECESEEVDEFQPVRKSRRRNRGQRYQELINEGIIQRSKERAAALQQTTPKDESLEEDSQPMEALNSYILPETAIRRIRKRTTSESAKDKMMQPEDAKRYKTGDFDLEAQIATLPPCSVENMGRKRGFARQRHSSECFHTNRKMSESDTSAAIVPVFDIKKAVSMPPHIKLPSENNTEPVVGSRKRKARKHSITHMIPAPPTLMNNGKVKAEGDSLGPCLIRPPGKELPPLNGKAINSSVTSEKCSDWSKSTQLGDQFPDARNRSLSDSEVTSDKTNTCVSKLKSGECTLEDKDKSGSVPLTEDCSLWSKTVVQSEEMLKNQSGGAAVKECVQKDVELENKQECEVRKDTTCGDNPGKQDKTENHTVRETRPDDKEFVSKQGRYGLVDSDTGDLLKIEKDVNSNTTLNA